MKKVSMIASAALALGAGSAHAALDNAQATAMMQKDGCAACHAIDKKIVGPAYKDVANKYRGDKNAEEALVQKVLKGGQGVWGQVPMPPNPVSEADAHALVKWVLSLK